MCHNNIRRCNRNCPLSFDTLKPENSSTTRKFCLTALVGILCVVNINILSVSAFNLRVLTKQNRPTSSRTFPRFYSNDKDLDRQMPSSSRIKSSESNEKAEPFLSDFSADDIIEGAEEIIQSNKAEKGDVEMVLENAQKSMDAVVVNDKDVGNSLVSSRRLFVASALIGTGFAAMSAIDSMTGDKSNSKPVANKYDIGRLQWETTPVNRRTGVTVFDAEQDGYNVKFVTYLSRFLLCFDADCQKWWYTRASNLPRLATAKEVEEFRLQQFAAFSASVEVGLQGYTGEDGPKRLLESLLKRYSPSIEDIKASREIDGQPPLTETALAKEEREIKEARRQIALLFGLMEKNQPVEQITKVLAAIDNGSINSVKVKNPGSGYAPGYGPPLVTFPEPNAGPGYERATGRALLRQNGKVLRIDVVNRGEGYTKAPDVIISSPALQRFGNSTTAKPATAKAILFRSGVNKGRIERIQLIDPGSGYTEKEIIRVKVLPPDSEAGVTATAAAIREYEVGEIQIVNAGSGYAVEKPIPVIVEPPPFTARVNMNDPLTARIISPDEPLPMSAIPSEEMMKKMPKTTDPSSVIFKVKEAYSNGKGTGSEAGACMGRGCYDTRVEAVAYPRAEKDTSYSSFRDSNTTSDIGGEQQQVTVVSGSTSGPGGSNIPSYVFGTPSSAQLLSLLPAGIGLKFDEDKKRYVLGVAPDTQNFIPESQWLAGSATWPLNPAFGPRGRAPIERSMELGLGTYLRFAASGAICCSGVHLLLTPIDVVKTKVQTNPTKYTGIISTFQSVLKTGGPSAFFTGWAPTFAGYFAWGGVAYAFTEFLRRYLTSVAGAEASDLQVPIILVASGIAAFVGSYVICPFEAIRIRSVAQPDYAPNIVQLSKRMIDEEGFLSLFSAVPAFLLKEIPFAMAKFTVFDLSTAYIYDAFPAAREDLQLSLAVSLAGGTLGGIIAAIVSTPADVVISEMKKAKTKKGPVEAAQIVLDRGGPRALFTGVGLRVGFISLIVSLQFFVYDAVRLSLGIGADDLKLYLDVLGGALQETGGPV